MVFDTNKLEPGYYGISEDKTLYKLSLRADLPLWSRSYNLTTGEVHYPTNRDRLRHMTDEELADFLWSIGSSPFSGNVYLGGKYLFFTGDGNGWLDWLKQEVQEDE